MRMIELIAEQSRERMRSFGTSGAKRRPAYADSQSLCRQQGILISSKK